MADDSIDINKINTDFNENTEPKDDKLMELLKQAYTQQSPVRSALIALEKIQPFSDFQPEISKSFRDHFSIQMHMHKPPQLYVYEQDGKFIMSDDYASYYLYKENSVKEIPCVILGDHDENNVIIYLTKPYHLLLPTVEILE